MATIIPDNKPVKPERREPVGKPGLWILMFWAGGVLAAAVLVGFLFSQ